MPDWIVVDIIDVCREISFIADDMLPETALPYGSLIFRASAWISLHWSKGANERFCECFLDKSPSGRKINVPFGKCPNAMNVVRQNDKRVDIEWEFGVDVLQASFEESYGLGIVEYWSPLVSDDCEERTGTRNAGAAISHVRAVDRWVAQVQGLTQPTSEARDVRLLWRNVSFRSQALAVRPDRLRVVEHQQRTDAYRLGAVDRSATRAASAAADGTRAGGPTSGWIACLSTPVTAAC